MKISGNAAFIRKLNRQIILNKILEGEVVSGAELARLTDLRPSTVSGILKELAKRKLIIRHGQGESTERGGRKPVLWHLNDKYYLVGLEAIKGEVTAVLTNLKGRIVASQRMSDLKIVHAEQLVKHIGQIVRNVFEQGNVSPDSVLGVGVGISGIVDSIGGCVRSSKVFPDKDFPLREYIEKEVGLWTEVENDANAAALGEIWQHPGKQIHNHNLIYFDVNENVTGIGCGVVIEGDIYRGSHFCAGEISSDLISLDSFTPQSVQGQISRIHTVQELKRQLEKGDPAAQVTWNGFMDFLMGIIGPIIRIFDPGIVVIGGDVYELEEFLIPSVEERLGRFLLQPYETITLKTPTQGLLTVAYGASVLIMHSIFSQPQVLFAHKSKERVIFGVS